MQKVINELQGFLEKANIYAQQQSEQGVVISAELARAGLNAISQFTLPPVSINSVINQTLDLADRKIPVRIYHPEPDKALPVLVYFHGGGHMCGSIDLYDAVARRLAKTAHHVVVSVEYRLAPEHPYPKGLEDCFAVVNHLDNVLAKHHADTQTISLGGDSAGGALASQVAYHCQLRTEINIAKLLLIYPSLDYTLSSDSYDNLQKGYLLETEKIAWYFDHYFTRNEDRKHASPLFFKHPEKMPATLLIAAGLDPLVNEGEAFIKILKNAGVDAQHQMEADLIHCFLNLDSLIPERMAKIYQQINAFLNS